MSPGSGGLANWRERKRQEALEHIEEMKASGRLKVRRATKKEMRQWEKDREARKASRR